MRKLYSLGSLALALAVSATLALPIQVEARADDAVVQVAAADSQDLKLSAERLQALERRAEDGDVDAMAALGAFYYSGEHGVEQDYGKALDYLVIAADKGSSEAMVIMADMYANGRGVEVDTEKAMDLLVVAAEKGNKEAQELLLYITDRGEEADSETDE